MEELNLGPPNTNPSSGREEDLNPGPPDYKSSALNTRPRCPHKVVECVSNILGEIRSLSRLAIYVVRRFIVISSNNVLVFGE